MTTPTKYLVCWYSETGQREYPGCDRETATCATREEAEACIASLRETDPGTWRTADLRIIESA